MKSMVMNAVKSRKMQVLIIQELCSPYVCVLCASHGIRLPSATVRNAFRLLAYAGEGMKDMEHTLMSDDPNEKAEWEDAIREAARMYKKNEFERMAAQHNR